jgi:predicted ATPase
VSFVFTDVERSTRQWEEQPEAMASAMARHDAIVRDAIAGHRGYVFATAGDGFGAAFWTPRDALETAVEVQARVAKETWPAPVDIAIRVGIHSGAADERDGDYFGPTVNRTARLTAAGHGGQILLSAVTAALADGFELLDLGEQRLKDLATPERVFQIGRRRFPPLQTSGVLTVRLPEWGTRFWGRAAEMEHVSEQVRSRRVVVLTGPGGQGKTRLAAQVAQQLVGDFAHSVYFVSLAGIVPDAVDYAIADGVGVQRELQRSALESLIAWLGDRRALLVLDNCEEVLETARAAVEALVAQCPQVHLLVTSRVPLGARGETRIPLPPLDRASAVDLLVDHLTTTMSRDLDLVASSDAMEELCARLDGVPLALELAAARCRTLTPAELLVRLERRPDVLADTARLFDERHRDLDRLIDWSWNELTLLARKVSGRLTVIIGGFTVDAAEAIAAEDDVDELEVVVALGELEDAGLTVREQTDADVRHRLLEPIRQRVAAMTAADERAAAARRHAEWFRELSVAVKAGSTGPKFGRWADLVERDLPNFRQAHRLMVDEGDAPGAVAIVDGLSIVGSERGLMELADWCDATVHLVTGRDDALELSALAAAVQFWFHQGRLDEIPPAAERMVAVEGDTEHHLVLAEYAMRATLRPDGWPEAIAQSHRALDRCAEGGATWASAHLRAFLVLLADLDASEVAPAAATLGSPVFQAMFTFFAAVPHYLRDEDRLAADGATESVRLARMAGATYQLAQGLMGQGGWRARLPECSDQEVFGPLAESLELWERLRISWGRIAVTEEIAQALAIRGHGEEAFVLWGAVDASRLEAPAKIGRARRTETYLGDVTPDQRDEWRARGALLAMDSAIAHARGVLATILS